MFGQRLSQVVSVTPTLAGSGAYSGGNSVGGVQSLAGLAMIDDRCSVPLLQSLTVTDADNQKAALSVLFFSADPTASGATVTDQQAFAWGTGAAFGKFLGKVNVATGDYESVNSKAIATLKNIGLALANTLGSTGLFAVVLTTGTPTYLAAGSLKFQYGFGQV